MDRYVDVTLYDLSFPVTYEQLCMMRNLIETGIDNSYDREERMELRTLLSSLYSVQMEGGRTFGELVRMIETEGKLVE